MKPLGQTEYDDDLLDMKSANDAMHKSYSDNILSESHLSSSIQGDEFDGPPMNSDMDYKEFNRRSVSHSDYNSLE